MSGDPLYQCECGAYVRQSQLLQAENPFDSEQRLEFCPECRDVVGDPLRLICDEYGCTETASCGWPSPDGYRNTCGKHMREAHP